MLSLCLAHYFSVCQSPADWWYFGDSAGVHFTPNGPVADTNGVLNTSEGCASISDNQGNLLFYSDGITVYDQNHQVMPNGNGLNGNFTTTQSAVVIPYPGQPFKYFLFTNSGQSSPSIFSYSVVDMTLNGGFGDVIVAEKNVFLLNGTSEKLAAVKSPSGFWVITTKSFSDTLYAFEVTSAGVNVNPVISTTPYEFGYAGYLKFSPSGHLIAGNTYSSTGGGANGIQLVTFNQLTGQVSSSIVIDTNIFNNVYGLEFSSNGRYLYSSFAQTIYQTDISELTQPAIYASITAIADSAPCMAAQMGPDQKIYIATISGFLHVIHEPNLPGIFSNVELNAVYLEGRQSVAGLPTFNASFFRSIEYEGRCLGDSTFFDHDTLGVDSVQWNFGDPASGVFNVSEEFFPGHVFTGSGSYLVSVISYAATSIDTTVKSIFIYPRQTLDLGPDTSICESDVLDLDIQQDYSLYLWSDGSTADSISILTNGMVSVTMFGLCDTLRDTLVVRFDKPIQFDLGPDTTFCEGPSKILDANVTVDAEYVWNTGDTADQITVTQSGLYIFRAENGCGEFVDSISISVIPLPDSALLPPDTINCFDAQIILERPVNDSITYTWSDSTSSLRFEVDSTQQVWLAALNECGFVVDTMNILFNGEIKTELGEDTNICDFDSIQLSGSDSTATYFWSTGDTSISIWTEAGLNENYIVTIFKGECAKVESKRIRSSDIFCPSIDCSLEYTNVFTPNGDGINDLFRITSDCDVYSFDMTIYNRWGQLVHFSQNVAFGWDGFINGEPASEGVYYFVVEYKDFVVVDADRQLTRGSFTLIR